MKYLKMLVFVVILGAITSGALIGVDAWTEERRELNEAARLQSAILDASEIAYTAQNLADVFTENIDTVTVGDFVYYVDPDTGYISFEFTGSGVWAPISGVITLQDDFQTIVRITVLDEEETPGLGGVVSERDYLDNYVGAELEVRISHDSDPDNPSDVDAITGGTRTSASFEVILNSTYQDYKTAWQEAQE